MTKVAFIDFLAKIFLSMDGWNGKITCLFPMLHTDIKSKGKACI